jgi:hypothetical protein
MIHRALLGSIERFFGVLLEHYAGAFPTWLAPEQVRILPVRSDHHDYASGLVDRLVAAGFRASLVEADEPTHGVTDHIDPRNLEVLTDRTNILGKPLGRCSQGREIEHSVGVTKNDPTIRLKSSGQGQHGAACTHEPVHEHDGRHSLANPRHVPADPIALHQMAGVVVTVCDRLDGTEHMGLQ